MEYKEFSVIPGYDNWVKIERLNKGWSNDQKYVVEDKESNKYLLRISDISLYDDKVRQFKMLQEVEKLNINASKPISMGKLNEEKMYMLLTWLEGEDAKVAVTKLDDSQAYLLGIEAGQILRRLQQIPIDENVELPWYEKFEKKMTRKIKALRECKNDVIDTELLVEHYEKHKHLIYNRKQTFTHGDFHLGNLIVHEGKIGVIDFDKNKVCDPYDDLKPYYWNVSVSEYFETGMINGYFDNQVPEDFFPILRLYTVEQLMSHYPWACAFGEKEIVIAVKMYNDLMKAYDNLNLVVPTWYKGVLKI